MRLCNCIFTLSRQSQADFLPQVYTDRRAVLHILEVTKLTRTSFYSIFLYLYLRLALTLPPPGSASYSIRALRGSLALHLDKSGARTMTVFAEQIPLLLALLRKPAQSLQCVSYSRYTAWRPRSITTMRDQHS